MQTLATESTFCILIVGPSKLDQQIRRNLDQLPDSVTSEQVPDFRSAGTEPGVLATSNTRTNSRHNLVLVLPSVPHPSSLENGSASKIRDRCSLPTFKFHREAGPEDIMDAYELGYTGIISLNQSDSSLNHSLSSIIEAVVGQRLEQLPFYL